jgi:hypothetical protein
VSKTGFEKGVKRVSVFDEMRVKLKPQPIINGDHKGVGSEWRLVKAQKFHGQALTAASVGHGSEDNVKGSKGVLRGQSTLLTLLAFTISDYHRTATISCKGVSPHY